MKKKSNTGRPYSKWIPSRNCGKNQAEGSKFPSLYSKKYDTFLIWVSCSTQSFNCNWNKMALCEWLIMLKLGVLSDPFPFDIAVQRCMASGHWPWSHCRWFVVWVSIYALKLQKLIVNINLWRLMHRFDDLTPMATPTPSYSISDIRQS